MIKLIMYLYFTNLLTFYLIYENQNYVLSSLYKSNNIYKKINFNFLKYSGLGMIYTLFILPFYSYFFAKNIIIFKKENKNKPIFLKTHFKKDKIIDKIKKELSYYIDFTEKDFDEYFIFIDNQNINQLKKQFKNEQNLKEFFKQTIKEKMITKNDIDFLITKKDNQIKNIINDSLFKEDNNNDYFKEDILNEQINKVKS